MATSSGRPFMSPRRRFLAAVLGGRRDRASVGNAASAATLELMDLVGIGLDEVHFDAEKMARLAATSVEVLHFDTIMPVFSAFTEATALGCPIDWGSRARMPLPAGNPWSEVEDIRVPSNFLGHPAVRTVLEAIAILRGEYGDRVAIVGKVMGPVTISEAMHGMERLLIETVIDPEKVAAFLRRMNEVVVLFARAQIQAGADVLCLGEGGCGGEVMSPSMYRKLVLPVHRGLAEAIGCPVLYHMCGDTTGRLPDVARSGFDCFHYDTRVDARQAKQVVGEQISLMGGVNNPQTLASGTPDDVRRDVFTALDAGVDVIAPECTVPLNAPTRNLVAINEAVIDYYGARRPEG